MNDLSELDAIDKAFGAHIVASLKVLADSGSHDYRQFLQRAPNQQVYRVEADSPKSFIQVLTKHQKQENKQENKNLNRVELPAIYYYRELGIETADAEHGNMLANEIGWTDDLSKSFRLSMNQLILNYRLVFVAHDKNTAQRLALAWHFYINNKENSQHRFTVPYTVQGEVFEVPCIIQDPQTLLATNLSQDAKIEGRLFALEVEHQLLAPVLYGHEVSLVDPIRWDFSFSVME